MNVLNVTELQLNSSNDNIKYYAFFTIKVKKNMPYEETVDTWFITPIRRNKHKSLSKLKIYNFALRIPVHVHM